MLLFVHSKLIYFPKTQNACISFLCKKVIGKLRLLGGAIALCNRQWLPSCGPGFESHAQHLCLFQFLKFKWYFVIWIGMWKERLKTNKRLGLAYFLFILLHGGVLYGAVLNCVDLYDVVLYGVVLYHVLLLYVVLLSTQLSSLQSTSSRRLCRKIFRIVNTLASLLCRFIPRNLMPAKL